MSNLGQAIALLGAGMAGYTRGVQQKRQADDDKADQDFKVWQRQQMQAQQARDDQTRTDVASASAPVSMQTIAGGQAPDTMDNIDAGAPGEAPIAPATYNVGGTTYTDPAQAQQALTAANSPTGVANRVASAYLKNGQPTMAMAMQRDAQQSELASLGLEEKHRDAANQMFDSLLDQQTSHQGIADFVSNSNHDGQGGALKLQAVPSADGKTVTYNRVNADGSLTPTGHTYTNDNNGIAQAQDWLSRNTPLAAKIANLHQQAQDARQAAHDQAETQHWQREDANRDEANSLRLQIAQLSSSRKPTPYDRLDEGTKLQYQGAIKSEQEASNAITEGLSKGTLDPTTPAYTTLQGNLASARRQRLGIEMRNGLVDPVDVAGGIVQGETDPAKIKTGVEQAYALGGKDFGDQVKKAAQPALDALTKPGPAAGAGGAPAPAPTTAGAARISPAQFEALNAAVRRKGSPLTDQEVAQVLAQSAVQPAPAVPAPPPPAAPALPMSPGLMAAIARAQQGGN